ncbi:flavin monoamine oxidase family protein [Methylosinus sporium]|uniref:Tryptophan 2-monooxygenase n=1 Tax=Methylosinus sporium TaxID=428 RepID=A0A549SNN4_METSR|nr:flavin monoamine oxidase family protein [Methylosinus sporium]TRL31177.1 flavin monoamine oxidase family protein [Methylosinus sporium]
MWGVMSEMGSLSRRELLALIGSTAGPAVMTMAMSSLGLAGQSNYRAEPDLSGAPKGVRVLVLGAGLAGLISAYELRRAGYEVEVLEYNSRVGGRNWTLRGGDIYTELGGETQKVDFDEGLYFNPGPWRIPHHHYAILDYCRRFGVALEPFVQVNHNAFVHSSKALGGRPVRYREVAADFQGYVAELLAKSLGQSKLDEAIDKEDKEILIEALRNWGALDEELRYSASFAASMRRGFDKPLGGGIDPFPIVSKPLSLEDILRPGLWQCLLPGSLQLFQTTLLQPVGGMDQISKAIYRELGDIVRFDAKVVAIRQNEHGARVAYEDLRERGDIREVAADWVVCTIPLSILSQIDFDASDALKAGVAAVPYGAAVKIGLQFKRRFWEEDDFIFGGVTTTDLPIHQIGYPNSEFLRRGKGVLLGAYVFGSPALEYTSVPAAERVRRAVALGARIHPQYPSEFENGVAVAWHRAPFALGCAGLWSDAARAEHYRNVAEIDGRLVLAGEHVSLLPAWQEGAALSALDAVTRLHKRILEKSEHVAAKH